MSQYGQLFLKQEIFLDVMVEMDNKILEGLGISVAGHRMKLLQGVHQLKGKNIALQYKQHFITVHLTTTLVERAQLLEEQSNDPKHAGESVQFLINHPRPAPHLFDRKRSVSAEGVLDPHEASFNRPRYAHVPQASFQSSYVHYFQSSEPECG
jgi:hypothetical protein